MRIFLLSILMSFPAFARDLDCAASIVEPAAELALQMLSITGDSFVGNCPPRPAYPDLFPGINNLKDLKKAVEEKTSKLGLTAKWDNYWGSGSWGKFEDTPSDVARLKRVANITLASMNLYPKDLFKKVKLKKLYFVKDLMVAGQLRKAMPDPSGSSLVYADNNDLVCEVGMEERVHHEFFHYIEAKLEGNMRYRDPEWSAVNKTAFSYGNGGQEVYNTVGGFQNLGHERRGFVSRYAMSAEEEDKSEMFGWMMTKGFSGQVLEWSGTDPLLKQKRDRMIKFMQTAVPEMDAAYFNNLTKD